MDTGQKNANGLMAFEEFIDNAEPAKNSSLERLKKQNAAKDELERLIRLCQTENDLLRLRGQIISTNYEDIDQNELLIGLDNYVNEQLASLIQEATQLEKRKEEKKNLWLGSVVFIVIGILLTGVFPLSLPIVIALVVIALIGNHSDSQKYKDSEKAAETLEKFRAAGYPIKKS